MSQPRVLVIDDDYGDSPALQADLKTKIDPTTRCDFSFCSGQANGSNSITRVLEAVESGWPPAPSQLGQNWALVLLDVQFLQRPATPQDSLWGFDVLRALRQRWSNLPIVMLTSGEVAKRSQANWDQADGFLPKPAAGDADSERAFFTRLYAFGLFPDLRQGMRLAGRSLSMLKVLQEARRFACDPLGSNRILYGETGTGKTELARFIHDEMSAIAGRLGGIRTWSAAGTNEDIAKDSLFGHWRGAHSMASTHEPGEIEKAEGGTFFLDEVASLPLSVQVLFMESRRRNAQLRRLISRMGTFPVNANEVRRATASVVQGALLGPDFRIAVDVVMLTASNVNLHDEEVADSLGFRRDLLNDLGAPIYLPSLNDRREDIPEIVAHIVQQIATHQGRLPKTIHPGVLSELQARDWTQKNVVVLRQVVEHAVTAARDFDEILIRHLPPQIDLPHWAGSRPTKRKTTTADAPATTVGASETPVRTIADLTKILERFEIPADPTAIEGVLPVLQGAYARLILKLFGAALRAQNVGDEDTSSLRAVCTLLGVKHLEGANPSDAAHDTVLRIVSLCNVTFQGLRGKTCTLLSDDKDVLLRVEQARKKRRRTPASETTTEGE